MTPQEEETELYLAKWMKRPPCKYIFDRPYYPWLPPEPIIPKVNFELGFKNKGQH